MNESCNRLMGYIAIPGSSGARTFLAVRCNRISGHSLFDGEESCAFTDDASGMPGTTHRPDCPKVSLIMDPEAAAKLRADLDAIARTHRQAWRDMQGVVIG